MRSVKKLLVLKEDWGYCQPCLSPIWDTVLVMHALMEAGVGGDEPAMRRATDWLLERQILEVAGDWAVKRPGLRPGGWAFQYRNDYYPDVDDTAVAGMALLRSGRADTEPQGAPNRSTARSNGSSACRARTAAGAPSMPTTRTTT